jgi:Histidine kinase/Histidine kinase-, DNA gyrase B-, and HSP90-like ATPase
MRSSLSFFIRRVIAWIIALLVFLMFWNGVTRGVAQEPIFIAWLIVMVFVSLQIVSHLRRVRLIVGDADTNASNLANRHRRQIELPVKADEAFQLIDAAIRELPRVEQVLSAPDSLQVRAKVRRPPAFALPQFLKRGPWKEARHDLVYATIAPHGDTCSVTLVGEPESGAWRDWFLVDLGANLENVEAISRAISRRVAEGRRLEHLGVLQTSNDKALALAKLGLLHAQIEPHFLYNTLGSAKYLVRKDAEKAEAILDNLITYLRHSLPRTEDTPSSLGDELQRASAYLDILKIRMGARLATHIDVPDALRAIPFPAMMLQTLVENAIKHGLEPKSGGGNIWILASKTAAHLSVTVADDGGGMNANQTETKGTGIGLNNVRERLQLAYGGKASFELVANFPSGVAATIRLPLGDRA